jgi:hypothetical protein
LCSPLRHSSPSEDTDEVSQARVGATPAAPTRASRGAASETQCGGSLLEAEGDDLSRTRSLGSSLAGQLLPAQASALLSLSAQAQRHLLEHTPSVSVLDRPTGFDGAALTERPGWVADGRLRLAEDVLVGFECASAALQGLFDGTNLGKRIVCVSPDIAAHEEQL